MKQPVLLVYNLGGERLRAVRMAAMRFKIRVRPVSPEEYGLTLAELLSGGDSAPSSGPAVPFDGEMLVMAFFPPGMMDPFLRTLRSVGAGGIALKAMLTPSNAAWSSARLHDELSREREALRAGGHCAHGDGPA